MPARRVAIALWIAALAACAAIVANTRFVADLSMFLPASPTEEQRLLVDQLREGALSRTLLIGIDGADAPTRARLSAALKQKLETGARPGPDQGQARARYVPGPGLAPVFGLVANGQAAGLERERELLLAHRYALSPNVTPERFTVEGLRAAVGETVDLLASPAGMLVKPFVTRDPTGEMLAVIERLRPEGGPRTIEGVWASRDGGRALLLARTKASGADTDAQARAVAAVEKAFEEAKNEIGPGAVAATAAPGATNVQAAARVTITGPGAFAVKSRALIKHDVERLAVASLILVAAILLAAYRSPLTLALGLVPVVSGALAGVAAVSLGFGAVHGITLGFGTTLIGEAIDYAIYLFVQSDRSHAIGDADWVARFWPTVRLGVLTSIAGFSALLFSGLPGLAQLGLYSITGLVAAAAVTRFVLPSLLPARHRIRDLTPFGEKLLAVTRAASKARWLVAIVALAAVAVLLTRPALWDADIASLNPISSEDRRQDVLMRADVGAADARSLVAVRGENVESALAEAERVGERLDKLVDAGTIAGYESPAKVLPSAATQKRRIEALPAAAELRARLTTALAQSPLSASKLGAFVEDVERARTQPPLTAEALDGTALGSALDGMLFRDASGRWNAIVALRPAENRAIDAQAARAALAPSAEKAFLVDVKAEADRLYAGYFQRALAMSAVGLAVIVALLFAALRSPGRVARVMAPLAAGVLFVAAWHALGGTRMNLLHLVGLLLVVAIGSNYALFFDRMAQGATSAPRTLASLTLANVTTVSSFGVLAISDIPVLHAIGSTVALGAAATLAFSAMLADPRTDTIGSGTRT
jgi:predicted exporter